MLRRELNYIGNNLNQAVKNINSVHGFPDTRLWINLLTIINGKLEPTINEIKEQGRMMNSAIISQINSELSLLGISSADIVMTGGGPGKASTDFNFTLQNIVYAWWPRWRYNS